jgi:hypothetical protein
MKTHRLKLVPTKSYEPGDSMLEADADPLAAARAVVSAVIYQGIVLLVVFLAAWFVSFVWCSL